MIAGDLKQFMRPQPTSGDAVEGDLQLDTAVQPLGTILERCHGKHIGRNVAFTLADAAPEHTAVVDHGTLRQTRPTGTGRRCIGMRGKHDMTPGPG
jgi:hypothetical protein